MWGGCGPSVHDAAKGHQGVGRLGVGEVHLHGAGFSQFPEIHHQSTLAVYVCEVPTLVVYVYVVPALVAYVYVVTGSEFPIAPPTRTTHSDQLQRHVPILRRTRVALQTLLYKRVALQIAVFRSSIFAGARRNPAA